VLNDPHVTYFSASCCAASTFKCPFLYKSFFPWDNPLAHMHIFYTDYIYVNRSYKHIIRNIFANKLRYSALHQYAPATSFDAGMARSHLTHHADVQVNLYHTSSAICYVAFETQLLKNNSSCIIPLLMTLKHKTIVR
jgi:hypothetical protein